MRIEKKTYYYFEKQEKELFYRFLNENNTNMRDFAKKCSISLSLLSLVINGKRSITMHTIEIFAKNGFKLGIKL